jgi:uncharacterized membrane protein
MPRQATLDHIARAASDAPQPEVRHLTSEDLRDALARGIDDFRAFPTHAIFICLIYPIVGLVLGRAAIGYDVLHLLFPLAAGFALLGPLAAVGLYEMSRRRELGLEAHAVDAINVLRAPGSGSIVALGFVLVALFVMWLAVANGLYIWLVGDLRPTSFAAFIETILGTPQGWALILLGNGIGFLFALAAFVIGAVSFPMIVDRHVGPAEAALTSVRVVRANPKVMMTWGLIVVAGLVLGSLPFFIGLAVVLPVLGHATWHLYRKAVG